MKIIIFIISVLVSSAALKLMAAEGDARGDGIQSNEIQLSGAQFAELNTHADENALLNIGRISFKSGRIVYQPGIRIDPASAMPGEVIHEQSDDSKPQAAMRILAELHGEKICLVKDNVSIHRLIRVDKEGSVKYIKNIEGLIDADYDYEFDRVYTLQRKDMHTSIHLWASNPTAFEDIFTALMWFEDNSTTSISIRDTSHVYLARYDAVHVFDLVHFTLSIVARSPDSNCIFISACGDPDGFVYGLIPTGALKFDPNGLLKGWLDLSKRN